jgi:hypothetical protein
MNRSFFEKYGRTIHEKLTGMGASFKFTADKPEAVFVQNGYRRLAVFSIVEKSMGFQSNKIAQFMLKTVFRTLAGGYAIYIFEAR